MKPDDTADRDWLYPEREAVDVTADTERPSSHVWRCDALECEPTQHASLIAATAEPPQEPEAQVYGGGSLLAIAADDQARWVLTDAGKLWIAREAHGVLAVAS